MRSSFLITMSVLAVLAGCGKPKSGGDANVATASTAPNAGPASQTNILDHMPARKPGLWIQTMSQDGKAPHMGEMRMCLDASTDAKMSMMGRSVTNSLCHTAMSRGFDGVYHYSSTCKMGVAGAISSKGDITGDFSSAYRVHSESDMTGANSARVPSHHVTDVEAHYGGACPTGMVAGDMMIGNAIRFNINKMPSLGEAMGGG